jgi:hypothetical protein
MGIKNLFKKVGRGVGKFAKNVWSGVKKGAEIVGKVAKPVLNVLSVLPGKVGLIGKIGSMGAGIAENIINKIPNKDARDKLNGFVDRGKNMVDKVENKAGQIANKIQPWAKFGSGVINMIKPKTF